MYVVCLRYVNFYLAATVGVVNRDVANVLQNLPIILFCSAS